MSIFKTAFNKAVNIKLISHNPAQKVRINSKDTKREFLTIDEIRQLEHVEIPQYKNVKDAFLLSCFTGLRFSDIKRLTFDDIRYENKEYYLYIKMEKTQDYIKIKLNKTARKIYQDKKESSGIKQNRIFKLPDLSNTLINLKNLTQAAGINKKITFHCARHTFACLLLANDVDIYTVSKLLGHRSVQTTQIYAKLIDKKRDEAIDKLPEI